MKGHPLRIALVLIAVPAFSFLPTACSDSPTQSNASPFPELDLLDPENQADYLMIVPRSLIQDLPRLVLHRENEGHSVAVVTLEQIAEAFPNTGSPEEGIRDFIAHAHGNWKEPRIQYVLLAGDTDLIPTFFFESPLVQFGETEVATDDPYATVKGDDDELPDLALGRFPVSNRNDLQRVIDKTIAFERSAGAYEAGGLIVADYVAGGSLALLFEAEAEEFAGKFPPDTPVQRLDLREDSALHASQNDFLLHVHEGTRVLAFLGYGNETLWADGELLNLDSLPALSSTGFPSLVVVHSSSQKFHDYGQRTLIRELILIDDGGSVASIAPSGVASFQLGRVLLGSFWDAIWSDPERTVGTALLAAKRAHDAGRNGDFAGQPSRYTLLGDPALRVGTPAATSLSVER